MKYKIYFYFDVQTPVYKDIKNICRHNGTNT